MRRFAAPRLAVSRCLGIAVCRYDGQEIAFPAIKELRKRATLIPICPEEAIGLGTPRPEIRLIRRTQGPAELWQEETGLKLGKQMREFTGRWINERETESASFPIPLDGLILKSKSPSCGISDCKTYDSTKTNARLIGRSDGVFAEEILKRYPLTPHINEIQFEDRASRDLFLTRSFTLAELRRTMSGSAKKYAEFHARYQLLLSGFHTGKTAKLNKLAEQILTDDNPEQMKQRYAALVCEILATTPRMTSQLKPYDLALDFYAGQIHRGDIARFEELREAVLQKDEPLPVLRELVKVWAVRYEKSFVRENAFCNPYPAGLLD